MTLGHRERSDLECVLDYLGQKEWVTGIALYGRSMGAATALLVASSDRCRPTPWYPLAFRRGWLSLAGM